MLPEFNFEDDFKQRDTPQVYEGQSYDTPIRVNTNQAIDMMMDAYLQKKEESETFLQQEMQHQQDQLKQRLLERSQSRKGGMDSRKSLAKSRSTVNYGGFNMKNDSDLNQSILQSQIDHITPDSEFLARLMGNNTYQSFNMLNRDKINISKLFLVIT